MTTDDVVGPRLRAVLAGIPRYVPGRPGGRPGDGEAGYKISSNENPYPPLPSVLEVVARAARTPDTSSRHSRLGARLSRAATAGSAPRRRSAG
jgi:histidinol-phosphate aminotransferase